MAENQPVTPTSLVQSDNDGRQTANQLSESERHRLLSSGRRRVVLDVLSERDTPIRLEELATAVASRTDGAATDQAVERTTIELHHCHLPKMADLGVVAYDPASRLIGAE